jgi:hypothetical protein
VASESLVKGSADPGALVLARVDDDLGIVSAPRADRELADRLEVMVPAADGDELREDDHAVLLERLSLWEEARELTRGALVRARHRADEGNADDSTEGLVGDLRAGQVDRLDLLCPGREGGEQEQGREGREDEVSGQRVEAHAPCPSQFADQSQEPA